MAIASPRPNVTPAPPGLPNPLGGGSPVRAVLFDLDGTLYHQPRMRRLMARELLQLPLRHPFSAARRLRGLREYRRAQEAMREPGAGADTSQLEVAAARARMPLHELEAVVQEWMFERPLRHMQSCRARGALELLGFLRRRTVPAAVFSDYPGEAKLDALGLAAEFSFVLCASQPEIGAFKPDPRGFLAACARWELAPHEVLMVGDRADVDAAGARAAGLPCVIIDEEASESHHPDGHLTLPSLERLHRVLDDQR